MSQYELALIGPTMVDILINCGEDASLYRYITQLLQLSPGDWVELDQIDPINTILGRVVNQDDFNLATDLNILTTQEDIEISPGSTGFDLLTAFDRLYREQTVFIGALAMSETGLSSATQYFQNEVNQLGSQLSGPKILGENPIGLVISSQSQQDKSLAMYPGISRELASLSEPISTELFYLDCYELQSLSISRLVEKIIEKTPVALGLSNHKILNQELIRRINTLINRGSLKYLVGNHHEFRTLLNLHPDLNNWEITEGVLNSGLAEKVPNILITMAEKGLCAVVNNNPHYKAAIRPERIVNTSGAGDICAGVFIQGIQNSQPIEKILHEAVTKSAQVIGLSTSHLGKYAN